MYNLWRNNKNKKLYYVLFLTKHCTNGREHETMVLYSRDGEYYTRELSEFLIKFSPTAYSEKFENLQKAKDIPYLSRLTDEYLEKFEEGLGEEKVK
ncbi:MAG: hypothetical protein ACRCX2_32850 [Paraclostridium sp.]